MPSIYNHENNACWGIRRTSYNIFNEPTNFDLNTNKADSTDCKEVKIENFHGSSNGYYGYVPTRIESDDSCAMDTSNDEHNSVHVSEGQTVTYDVNSNFNDFWKRKRSHPVDAEDSCKRTKVEEPENLVDDMSDGGSNLPLHNLPSDPRENDGLPVYNFYRCTMSHYM